MLKNKDSIKHRIVYGIVCSIAEMLQGRFFHVVKRGVSFYHGLFPYIGGYFCGCPCNKSLAIWSPYQAPDFLNSNVVKGGGSNGGGAGEP